MSKREYQKLKRLYGCNDPATCPWHSKKPRRRKPCNDDLKALMKRVSFNGDGGSP